MAKKKKDTGVEAVDALPKNAHILGAGEVVQQRITDTMELNFMPYAMSVIMSREYALPKFPLESTYGCSSASYPLDRRTIVS